MIEIIGVRFKRTGKIYYFDPAGQLFHKGERVVVETARGIELCDVWLGNRTVEDSEVVQPLRKVIRAATEEDLALVQRNEQRAKEAFAICEKKIAAHGLDMKLTDAEYAFDGNKLLFYFTADGRVDFRDLVKDLASVFRIRIELRQIGVRDEAKMYGGLGVCGRPLCCATFLDDFHPVSIKMAKEQGLSLNPTKISGNCSRLMCCLKYEQDAYEDLIRRCPRVDTVVQTPNGVGTIIEVNLLKQLCKVRFDKPGELPKFYPVSECRVLKPGERAIIEEQEAAAERERAQAQQQAKQEQAEHAEHHERSERPARAPRSDRPRGERAQRAEQPRSDRQERAPKQNNQPKQDRQPRQERAPKPIAVPQAKPIEKPAQTAGEPGANPNPERRRSHRGGRRRGSRGGQGRNANKAEKPQE